MSSEEQSDQIKKTEIQSEDSKDGGKQVDSSQEQSKELQSQEQQQQSQQQQLSNEKIQSQNSEILEIKEQIQQLNLDQNQEENSKQTNSQQNFTNNQKEIYQIKESQVYKVSPESKDQSKEIYLSNAELNNNGSASTNIPNTSIINPQSLEDVQKSVDQSQHQVKKKNKIFDNQAIIKNVANIMENIKNSVSFSGSKQSQLQQQQPQQAESQINHEIELDQQQVMKKAQMDRKKENFNRLKEWDLQRASFLNHHRNILEAIMGKIDQIISSSMDMISIIVKFFHAKGRQEVNYSRTPIIKTSVTLKDNLLGKSTHLQIKDTLDLLDRSNLEHEEKVSHFANVIEQRILIDLLVKNIEEYNKTMENVRSNIIQIKKQLSVINQQAQQKSFLVGQVYRTNTAMPEDSKPQNNQVDKDFYKKQLSFLRLAAEQTEVQRLLAKETLQFWKLGLQQEQIRIKIYQQAFELYQEGFDKCYGKTKESENITSALTKQLVDDQAIIKLFNPGQLLLPNDIEYLKSELKIDSQTELTTEDMTNYFENFSIEYFNDKMLIIKEIFVQRELQPNQFIATRLVITPDQYLHCFDQTNKIDQSVQKIYKKPDLTIKISKFTMNKLDETMIEIQIPQRSYLKILKHSEIQRFKFKTNDEAEEFQLVMQTI